MAEKPENNLPKFLNGIELSSFLSVDIRTIKSWVSKHKFPAPIRLGPRVIRWNVEKIMAFMEEHKYPKAENQKEQHS